MGSPMGYEDNDWLFTPEQLENTPSRQTGVSKDLETRYRRDGCLIISQVGLSCNLKENPTIATACTFFHRFYMMYSFKRYPLEISALGCLFLAGKVEETPKKCRDLVSVGLNKGIIADTQYTDTGLVNDVIAFEKVLLASLGFDLHIVNPYNFLLNYAKIFHIEKNEMSKVVQFAWTFLNDCAGFTLCLQYEPEIIAIALLQMGLKFYNFDPDKLDWEGKSPSSDRPWWDSYVENLAPDMVDELCHSALDYYESNGVEEHESA